MDGYWNNKGVKNMKNAFLKPLTMQLNMVWEPNSHISMLNMNQKFYICWRSGPRGPIPPLMMSRIDGKHCNSYTICLQARCKIYLYHKTFTFYDDSLSFLVWQFSFWYCIMKVANKLRWVVGEIDPTGFGLYPTSVPTGVIVQKFQTQSLSGISEKFLQEVTALHSK